MQDGPDSGIERNIDGVRLAGARTGSGALAFGGAQPFGFSVFGDWMGGGQHLRALALRLDQFQKQLPAREKKMDQFAHILDSEGEKWLRCFRLPRWRTRR